MAITGGFGMMVDLERGGAMRRWVMGRDGVKRWLDSGEPCEPAKPYNPDEDPTAGKPWPIGLDSGRRQRAARKMGDEAKKAMLLDPTKNTPELDAAVSEYLFDADGAATKPPKGRD